MEIVVGLAFLVLVAACELVALNALRLCEPAWGERQSALLHTSADRLKYLQNVAISHSPDRAGARFRDDFAQIHVCATARHAALTSARDALYPIRRTDFPRLRLASALVVVLLPFEITPRLVWWWRIRAVENELARLREVNASLRMLPQRVQAQIEQAKRETEALAARLSKAKQEILAERRTRLPLNDLEHQLHALERVLARVQALWTDTTPDQLQVNDADPLLRDVKSVLGSAEAALKKIAARRQAAEKQCAACDDALRECDKLMQTEEHARRPCPLCRSAYQTLQTQSAALAENYRDGAYEQAETGGAALLQAITAQQATLKKICAARSLVLGHIETSTHAWDERQAQQRALTVNCRADVTERPLAEMSRLRQQLDMVLISEDLRVLASGAGLKKRIAAHNRRCASALRAFHQNCEHCMSDHKKLEPEVTKTLDSARDALQTLRLAHEMYRSRVSLPDLDLGIEALRIAWEPLKQMPAPLLESRIESHRQQLHRAHELHTKLYKEYALAVPVLEQRKRERQAALDAALVLDLPFERIRALQTEYPPAEAVLQQVETERRKLREQCYSEGAHYATILGRLKELHAQLEGVQTAHATHIRELRARVETLQNQALALRTDYRALEQDPQFLHDAPVLTAAQVLQNWLNAPFDPHTADVTACQARLHEGTNLLQQHAPRARERTATREKLLARQRFANEQWSRANALQAQVTILCQNHARFGAPNWDPPRAALAQEHFRVARLHHTVLERRTPKFTLDAFDRELTAFEQHCKGAFDAIDSVKNFLDRWTAELLELEEKIHIEENAAVPSTPAHSAAQYKAVQATLRARWADAARSTRPEDARLELERALRVLTAYNSGAP